MIREPIAPAAPNMIPKPISPAAPNALPPPPDPMPRLAPSSFEMAGFALRVTTTVLITVLILSVAYMCWQGIHVLLLAFAGMLFAIFLSALGQWVSQRTLMPYGCSLAVVLVGLLGLIVGMGWFLSNRLAMQLEELVHQVPQSVEEGRKLLSQYPWGQFLLEQGPSPREIFSGATEFSHLTGLLSGVADVLVSIVIIVSVGIFGAANAPLYREGLFHVVPKLNRARAREAVDCVAFNLRCWLMGQVFLMVAIGVATTIGLWLIGVPLALTLGLIAGALEIIPYIGPWMSAVPAVLVAVPLGPGPLAMTLVLYLAIHLLEGYVLLPLVTQRVVHLPPALTLLMQALLGTLLGLTGLFVAAPLTVAAVVLIKMLYVKDTLGDQAGESAKPPDPMACA